MAIRCSAVGLLEPGAGATAAELLGLATPGVGDEEGARFGIACAGSATWTQEPRTERLFSSYAPLSVTLEAAFDDLRQHMRDDVTYSVMGTLSYTDPHMGEVRVTDGAGRPAPPGQTGDVWLRTGTATRAYVGDPQASAAVFADGWTRIAPLTAGRNVPTISRMAEGNTLTPRTISMSSVRPMQRTRGAVRPQAQGPTCSRT